MRLKALIEKMLDEFGDDSMGTDVEAIERIFLRAGAPRYVTDSIADRVMNAGRAAQKSKSSMKNN